jgi:hypothetical protein
MWFGFGDLESKLGRVGLFYLCSRFKSPAVLGYAVAEELLLRAPLHVGA